MVNENKTESTKKPGHPVKNVIKPISDTPENVAKSIMKSMPKKNWDYQKA